MKMLLPQERLLKRASPLRPEPPAPQLSLLIHSLCSQKSFPLRVVLGQMFSFTRAGSSSFVSPAVIPAPRPPGREQTLRCLSKCEPVAEKELQAENGRVCEAALRG